LDSNIKYFLEDIGRTVPDGATAVMGKNRIFFLHPTRRFDPATLAIAALAAGTVTQMQATRQEGRDAERIAERRAAVDIASAEATRRSSVEEAKLRGERGRKLIEKQKSQAAAGNIRINVGAPLVIEEETQEDIATDIGFALERGRTESALFRSSAGLEIETGKSIKRQKKSSALAQGLAGAANIGFSAHQAGFFAPRPPVANFAGLNTSPGFGTPLPGGGRFA
jgi:hypothetical protein